MNWLPRPRLPGKKPRSHQCRLHVSPDFQTVTGRATAERMESFEHQQKEQFLPRLYLPPLLPFLLPFWSQQ